MTKGHKVEDGRLIRRPRFLREPGYVCEEEQEYWNRMGWQRPDIHCQTCGRSAKGNLDHVNYIMSKMGHEYKATLPECEGCRLGWELRGNRHYAGGRGYVLCAATKEEETNG